MRIKFKLIIGFLFTILSILTIAIIGSTNLAEINTKLNQIVEVSGQKVKLAARINQDILNTSRHIKAIVIVRTLDEVNQQERIMEAIQREMDERIKLITPLLSPKEVGELKKFSTVWASYLNQQQQIISLRRADANNKAATLALGLAHDQIEQATILITRIVDSAEKKMQMEKVDSDKVYDHFSITWITISSIILLILGGLFYWIIFGISSSVNALQILVSKLSQGDLTTTKTALNPDEIGKVYDESIAMQVSLVKLSKIVDEMAKGNFSARVELRSNEDSLAISINSMADNIANMDQHNKQQHWLQQSLIELANSIQQSGNIQALATTAITQLCHSLDAKIGALYFLDPKNRKSQVFQLLGSYAFTLQKSLSTDYKMGEGLVGQAALDQSSIILQNAPDDYIKIESALGDTPPRNIIVVPIVLLGSTLGVIEIGFTEAITANQQDFIERSQAMLAIAFDAIKSKDAQSLAEELKVQQVEMLAANEELIVKTKALQQQSMQLRKAQQISEQHSVELQASNQYKSEFLANMSHELRTPLNSLLILAGLLAKNKQGTLTEDQVDSAQVIQKSGQHLLQLINDILDLSKIEAGHMDVTIAPTEIPLLSQALQQRFTPLVKEKSLDFNVVMVNELPDDFKTDAQKLEQILTNLISNAIKFTQQGEIRLEVSYQKEAELFPGQPYCVCFSVIDSGIGIAKEQQERIFGAFQQVDGSNRRKQGGTGLGLSIALAYAHILGGHLKCQSKMGKGSQFDLYIPEVPPVNQIMSYHAPAITEPEYHESISNEPVSAAPFPDDRDDIGSDDLVILVLEDDIEFAKILYREAKQKGYKCIVSDDAESTLKLALQHQVSGILLDFCLPNMDGKAFLDKMKRIPAIRYIPVHVISVLEDTKDYWKQGVVGYLTKPVSQAQIVEALDCISQFSPTAIRHLLIVEDDKDTQQALVKLLRNDNVEIDTASTVKDALQVLKTEHCDCLILDIGLPDGSGFDLLDAIELETNLKLPPLIVYTAKELTPEETQNLRQYTDSIIIKTKHSTERLKDETALFLHQAREKKVEPALEAELLVEFSNKTLLLVDDDMRNSLALNKVLKELGIIVTMVTSGQDALDKLAEDNIFNWVIMDIMMPDMDGYETMRRIRAQDRFKYLPLLAITAKAMKGDKEKCLEAGASDYLSKPIDINKLTQLLHVWISK